MINPDLNHGTHTNQILWLPCAVRFSKIAGLIGENTADMNFKSEL